MTTVAIIGFGVQAYGFDDARRDSQRIKPAP